MSKHRDFQRRFAIKLAKRTAAGASERTYANNGGNSNVVGYVINPATPDRIAVRFGDGSRYVYTYESAGEGNVEQMKMLAERGQGLNAFINTRVKKMYAEKTA